MSQQICLASKSPRRQELLRQIGVSFVVHASDAETAYCAQDAPLDYVQAQAVNKALSVSQERSDDLPVLGSDTAVVLEEQVLGKPENRDDALQMLDRLSGRWHEVMTAVVVIRNQQVHQALSITAVRFGSISQAMAEAYWETGEPRDKAGGYAIQGRGGLFVEELRGSYSGVVGLPLFETRQLLNRFSVYPEKSWKGSGG